MGRRLAMRTRLSADFEFEIEEIHFIEWRSSNEFQAHRVNLTPFGKKDSGLDGITRSYRSQQNEGKRVPRLS